ncbi:uncharacterized protein [Branchiostoma lanceolatum]|uniref:uncharacterized protein n=1 Tax=Branchiostoma lanceolatum TaxID=7740 RepID=UPI0034516128
MVATESACLCLPLSSAEQLRSEVAGILRTVKPPKSNITKQEREALKELRKDKNVLILPADKGKATVLMDRTDYEEKVSAMLADGKTYEKLPTDPTQKYKRKLVAILTRLLKESKITEEQKNYLYPTAENVPRMYCTPKIHKPGYPLRPIVDYTGSIGYNTSRALADLLAPLVGKSVHHIKNSKHLAEEMSTILIEEDDMFLSHDVVSLFTNTPIPETLDIIRRRLQEDRDLKNRTNLQVDDILELLSFIVTTTYFSFRGNIYQQKFGTAMGSPVSPVLANLFMEWLEQQAMATVPVTCRPKLWKRYVDDVMEVVKRGAQQELTDHLNNTDPTGNIQFTYEEEEKGTLPFLDTLLVRKGDGSVKLLVYRKSTHTDQYLNFQSHHPLHQKLGVIRTLMDRCNAVVTEDQDKELETQHIKRALMRCGYPEWTFQKVEQQRRRKQTEKTKTSKQQEEKAKGMVIIPYIKGVTEPLERMFRKHNVATAVRPKTTLRSLLVHPKDKVDDLAKTDCVYKVPCASCEEVYIGETGRTLGTRLKEHQKEATDSDAVKYTRSQKRQAQQEEKKSAISDHVARNNCVIDWEGAKVIDREDNRRIRWIKEAENENNTMSELHTEASTVSANRETAENIISEHAYEEIPDCRLGGPQLPVSNDTCSITGKRSYRSRPLPKLPTEVNSTRAKGAASPNREIEDDISEHAYEEIPDCRLGAPQLPVSNDTCSITGKRSDRSRPLPKLPTEANSTRAKSAVSPNEEVDEDTISEHGYEEIHD